MEEVIAHCWQVAVADMWFLWRKCVLVAVNRNQVVNKFIWRDYTQEILQFYNIIQIPKNFILLTIHMMWICLLKMLNTKNTVLYSLVEQRMPIHLQLILCHQQGNSAVFCQFKKKKKKITKIPIRRIKRYYGQVPEKDLLHLLSLKCFYCSSISTKLTFFAMKERLIRIGW